MTPQAIPYRRYSSKRQNIGSSEARQGSGFDAFLGSSGMVKGPEYFDRGRSGYHDAHRSGDFGRLLADCAGRKFPVGSVVWFENMDRFGRLKLAPVLADWSAILSAGYKIHVSSLGQTFTEQTEQMQLMGVILQAILAHEESAKKAVRVKAAWKERRTTGRTKTGRVAAVCPKWLTVSEDGQSYTFNQFAKQVRTACLEAMTKGQTLVSVASGIKATALTRIFRSRTLIGEFQARDDKGNEVGAPVENYYPALLTMDEFRRLQDSLDRRQTSKAKRTVRCTDLFSGLCFDANGTQLRVKETYRKLANGSTQRTFWLNRYIMGVWAKGGACHYNIVEETLLDLFCGLTVADLYPVDSSAAQRELNELKANIADKKATQTALEARMVGKGGERFISAFDTICDELEALETALEALEGRMCVAKVDHLADCKELISAHLEAQTEEQKLEIRFRLRETIAQVVSRVVVDIRSPQSADLTVTLSNGQIRRVGCVSRVAGLTVGLVEE